MSRPARAIPLRDPQVERRALLEKLRAKTPVTVDLVVPLDEGPDAETVTLTFRGLPRGVLAQLRAEHPPTDEQVNLAREKGLEPPEWDPDTFAPALIAASCTAFAEVGEVEGLLAEWSEAEAAQMYLAALTAQNRTRRAEDAAGKASGPTPS